MGNMRSINMLQLVLGIKSVVNIRNAIPAIDNHVAIRQSLGGANGLTKRVNQII